MKLKDKFAVVTGASTGIGRAIAIEFAKEGAFVALVGRKEDKLLETKNMITKKSRHADVFLGDLSKIDSIESLTAAIKQKTEKIDILVNVAGIWHGKNEAYADKNFETFSRKVILDTFSVGLITPTLLAYTFIPIMPKGGKILNISGTFESGAKGWLPYYVSKRGIEDLTIGLSEELKNKGILVNAISPSDTITDAYKKYFPEYIANAVDPEEIGKYAAYLCSSESQATGKVFVIKKNQKPFEGYHA